MRIRCSRSKVPARKRSAWNESLRISRVMAILCVPLPSLTIGKKGSKTEFNSRRLSLQPVLFLSNRNCGVRIDHVDGTLGPKIASAGTVWLKCSMQKNIERQTRLLLKRKALLCTPTEGVAQSIAPLRRWPKYRHSQKPIELLSRSLYV